MQYRSGPAIILLLAPITTTFASAVVSGGSLGPFNPTSSQTISLEAQAPDGVLNYTTVNIPAGVEISFTANAANTPVIVAATGDVVISGTINVSAGHFSGIAGQGYLRFGTGSLELDPAATFEAVIVDSDDSDGDGVPDSLDNCTALANPDQRDTNADGFGNVCDADLDGDCVVNFTDLGMLKAVFFSSDPNADFDGDGTVTFSDLGIMKLAFFAPPGLGAMTGCP